MDIQRGIDLLHKGSKRGLRRVYQDTSIPVLKHILKYTPDPDRMNKAQKILENVFVDFWNEEQYIGLDTIDEIQKHLLDKALRLCIIRDKDKFLLILNKSLNESRESMGNAPELNTREQSLDTKTATDSERPLCWWL